MALLELSDIRVEGLSAPRLQSINLTLHSGQLVGVIGANGAGKSSLLKAIAGLLTPATGHVAIDQQPMQQMSARQKAEVMAYLPQREQPQWDVSVIELIKIGLLQHRLSRSEQQLRIDQVVTECDLVDLSARALSTLSGGEQQRALLARALVGQPKLLLCDEPTSALDINHQLHTMQLLQQRSGQGQLVLCCLHDLPLAARFCDQLVLLNEGKLIDVGGPAKVLSDANLAQVFGIKAQWFCEDSGVAWLPQPL